MLGKLNSILLCSVYGHQRHSVTGQGGVHFRTLNKWQLAAPGHAGPWFRPIGLDSSGQARQAFTGIRESP